MFSYFNAEILAALAQFADLHQDHLMFVDDLLRSRELLWREAQNCFRPG